jgi:hypothetical protein
LLYFSRNKKEKGGFAMEYTTIRRFSDEGFAPKLQTYHLKDLKRLATGRALREWDRDTKEHYLYRSGREEIVKRQKEINFDFAKGVWVFIGENCDLSLTSHLLNHLPRGMKKYLKCWEAKIPYDAIVYDTNDLTGGVFSKNNIKPIAEVYSSAFIPESSIHLIYDIIEIQNPYTVQGQ